ncbi:hypothetical protein ACFO5Q_08330 [Kordiimonas lipolytica]|uniref:Uncharacterized protein n=1 Tax=Kordiimonas lipolytica TaxID=1662421 RepID=A0ABV8UAB3_9PROT|nr:hypothetical protein [Kordiimonas lipolytica]
MKTFLKIAATLFLLFAAVVAYGVYELWPEPYKPTYTVELPMLNGVPGVVLAVDDPKSEFAKSLFRGPDEVRFRGNPIDGFWRPSEPELAEFEATLNSYVWQHPPSDAIDAPHFIRPILCSNNEADQLNDLLTNSFRQYVGFYADGQRYLQVIAVPRATVESLAPNIPKEELEWRQFGTADAGPTSIAVYYSFDTGQIIELFYDEFFGGVSPYC